MGTINSYQILTLLDAAATKRDWVARKESFDGRDATKIYRRDEKHGDAELIATFCGDNHYNDAALVIDIRNTLPEMLRSMYNRDFRIAYLEGRVRELEAQLTKEDQREQRDTGDHGGGAG